MPLEIGDRVLLERGIKLIVTDIGRGWVIEDGFKIGHQDDICVGIRPGHPLGPNYVFPRWEIKEVL